MRKWVLRGQGVPGNTREVLGLFSGIRSTFNLFLRVGDHYPGRFPFKVFLLP